MNFQNVSHDELMVRFGRLVQSERKITAAVLEYIAEIDVRKIYLERAYPSLFELLTKEFGYSASAAMRRICGARMLRDVPQISEHINSGVLNLSQLSQVQAAVKSYQQTHGHKLDRERKTQLVQQVMGATQAKTEQILAEQLQITKPHFDKQSTHRDGSVTLTITFTQEQLRNLNRAKDLVSHAAPDGNWAQVLNYLSEREINRRTKGRTSKSVLTGDTVTTKAATTAAATTTANTAAIATDVVVPAEKPIAQMLDGDRGQLPVGVARAVFAKYQTCQYLELRTGRPCGGTKYLQIEHRRPVWAGGGNEFSNLTVLCASHNRWKYQRQAGISGIP